MNFKCNFSTKQIIWMFVFSIGVVFMIVQSWSTIDTFISFRTTLAISKEPLDTLPTPTVVVCQEHKWKNGHFEYENGVNISDKDWVLKQFYQLNDKMNITITSPFYLEVETGNNSVFLHGMESKFIVKEILNPWNGLCYAMIPPDSAWMNKSDYLMASITFSKEIKKPILSAYLIRPEDWYGMMLPYFGNMKPFKITLTEFGTFTGITIQQRKYCCLQDTFYLPSSMTKCRNYSLEESYLKCKVKNSVDLFDSLANSTTSGCTCIPNNTYKSYFEIQPTSLEWEECKTNTENDICTTIMVFLDQGFLASQCPRPCEKVDYTGEIFGFNGGSHLFKSNEFGIQIVFNTMDTEICNEILTFDLANFIGTAGGSLGLFIGFSFTGFVWQVLDYAMRD